MRIEQFGQVRVGYEPIEQGGRASRREHECAAVRRLVDAMCGENTAMGHDAKGAPFIEGHEEMYLSVSHSATQAVVAIAPHPVGVDTETLRPQLERVLDRFLSKAEQLIFDTPHKHLVAWCVKEAAYKIASIPGVDFAHDITIHPGPDNLMTPSRVTVRENIYIYHVLALTPTTVTILVTPTI